MNKKFCPIIALAPSSQMFQKQDNSCLESGCAWYNPYCKECAVLNIAHMVGNATDKVVKSDEG